jgi:hypothetical protein
MVRELQQEYGELSRAIEERLRLEPGSIGMTYDLDQNTMVVRERLMPEMPPEMPPPGPPDTGPVTGVEIPPPPDEPPDEPAEVEPDAEEAKDS